MLISWYGYVALVSFFMWQTLSSQNHGLEEKLGEEEGLNLAMMTMRNRCIETGIDEYFSNFAVCFFKGVILNQYESKQSTLPIETRFWKFDTVKSSPDNQVFVNTETCEDDGHHYNMSRVIVKVECCNAHHVSGDEVLFSLPHTLYSSIEHPSLPWNGKVGARQPSSSVSGDMLVRQVTNQACETFVTLCYSSVCKASHVNNATSSGKVSSQSTSVFPLANEIEEDVDTTVMLNNNISPEEQRQHLEKVKEVFYHAYDSYMTHAFPKGELRPISCEGGNFDLIKIPLVTLIDTLDTLVLIDDAPEFRRAVRLVVDNLPNAFDFDQNISVFETTIRLLGGLLSAHLFAIDGTLQMYPENDSTALEDLYHHELLHLAIDLGDRLMPAFNTKTGIPYGTVNLHSGVPRGETKVASTAGAGSLFVEFHVLSLLTGDEKYGMAALRASYALYERRSPVDLVGKHINIESGQWQETVSGVGSNSDSFYEYHLKAYALLQSPPVYEVYDRLYRAVKHHIIPDDTWFTEVDMFSGRLQRHRVENLDAFWPGLETAMGHFVSSAKQLQALYSVWMDLGFLPEEIDLTNWRAGKGASNGLYPLRPELIESTYYQYRATGDRSWLAGGALILDSIQNFTRTGCGFASVANVASMELSDEMPSFFLSETIKYLYLLFDDDHFLHRRAVLYSTEAHPFDLVQLRSVERDVLINNMNSNEQSSRNKANSPKQTVYVNFPEELLSPEERTRRQQRQRQQQLQRRYSSSSATSSAASSSPSSSGSTQKSSMSHSNKMTARSPAAAALSEGEVSGETIHALVEQQQQHLRQQRLQQRLSCALTPYWALPPSLQTSQTSAQNGHLSAASKKVKPTTAKPQQTVPERSPKNSKPSSHAPTTPSRRTTHSPSSTLPQRPQSQQKEQMPVSRSSSKRPSQTTRAGTYADQTARLSPAQQVQRERQRFVQHQERQRRRQRSSQLAQSVMTQYAKYYPSLQQPSAYELWQRHHVTGIAVGGETIDQSENPEGLTIEAGSPKSVKCGLSQSDEATLPTTDTDNGSVGLSSLEHQLLHLHQTLNAAKQQPSADPTSPRSGQKNHLQHQLHQQLHQLHKQQLQELGEPLKAVELSLGTLGQFDVKVFPDAFQIVNKRELLTVDIMNVGRRSIFVRQFDPQAMLAGGLSSGMGGSGFAGDSGQGSDRRFDVSGLSAHSKGYVSCVVEVVRRTNNSAEIVLTMPCSVSSFSRNRPSVVEAPLVVSRRYDSNFCNRLSATAAAEDSSLYPQEAAEDDEVEQVGEVGSADGSLEEIGKLIQRKAQLQQLQQKKRTLLTSTMKTISSPGESGEITPQPRYKLDEHLGHLRRWFRESLFSSSSSTSKSSTKTTQATSNSQQRRGMSSDRRSGKGRRPLPMQSLIAQAQDDLRGKIVMADRGDCLFETKAEHAEAEGAKGIIIKNKQMSLFFMSGKKDMDVTVTTQVVVEESPAPQIDLPAVMIAAHHVELMWQVLQEGVEAEAEALDEALLRQEMEEEFLESSSQEQRDSFEIGDGGSTTHLPATHPHAPEATAVAQWHARIVVEDKPALLLSSFLGNPLYPKVWVTKSTIFVQTQGRWGAFFQNQDGKADWQMYLIDLADSQTRVLLPASVVRSPQRRKMSTTATLMLPAGEVYHYTVQRKCPAQIFRVKKGEVRLLHA